MIQIIFSLFFLLNSHAFDWQSHRGARGLYPENTIGAMKVGLSYPAVTTLEMDSIISQDNLAVVSHEPWLEGETCLGSDGKTSPVGKEVNLYKLDYQKIAQFDCGSKPHPRFPIQKKVVEHKPLLFKLLATMQKEIKKSKRQVRFSIEVKSTEEEEKNGYQPDYKKMTEIIVETWKRLPKPRPELVIQSFDWRVLDFLSSDKRYKDFKQVALIEVPYDYKEILKKLKHKPAIFSPSFEMLTPEQIKFFHEQGVKVIPWTVNEASDMEKMVNMGVDGIITDYPDRINGNLIKLTMEKGL